MKYQILSNIRSPEDIRILAPEKLQELCSEIRAKIIESVSQNGGHLAPNLGVVELAVALHHVFHAPHDKILWDVSHQAYPHKLLTGRFPEFDSIRKINGLSGFTCRSESEYDCFGAGHAGTAISAAMGFEAAAELTGEEENVVAVVGDGALINGISMEALNNLRSTCKNLIVIVNDNKMSISRSIGAIPNYLNQIITGRNYNRFKAFAKMMIRKMPRGENIIGNIRNLEASAKSLFVPGIFFEELGIRYIGPIDGHKLPDLIQALQRVKEFHRPVLVHVITEKGHGCDYAEHEPERYHGIGKFDPENGTPLSGTVKKETFSSAFGKALMHETEADSRIVSVTAAMASGCGISQEYITRFPHRFFDVGIAEEHALVFAAGLAAGGLKPVVAMYATFLQRGLDCIFHDICLQDLPVVICADRAGIVEDGPTHNGIYDVSFLRSMPNLSILSPRNETEVGLMLHAALQQEHPCVIRYPRGNSGAPQTETAPHDLTWGKSEELRPGNDVMIFAAGRECYTALSVSDLLAEHGVSAGVINVRFLKPFDAAAFLSAARKCRCLVTLEDHVKNGGLASIAADSLVFDANTVPASGSAPLLSFGWDCNVLLPHGDTASIRESAGMTPQKIAEKILLQLRSV